MKHNYTIPIDDGFLRDSCCVSPEEKERRHQAYLDAVKDAEENK